MNKLFLILLIIGALKVEAQSKKNDTLREVLIHAKNTKINAGSQSLDSSILNHFQHTSLQNVLQLHSNVFVKNYGVGSLSTISMRGSSAAQTSVLWQGMNINNAMTGINDFSTTSTALFDEINIHYENKTPNAIGGQIELNNSKPIFQKQQEISLGINYESLQNKAIRMTLSSSNAKNYLRLKIYAQNAENRYKYYNDETESYDILKHARSMTSSAILDYYINIKSNKILSFHSWNTLTNREIPPATFETKSAKKEINSGNRFLLKYDYQNNRYSSLTSLGFIHDQLKYEDSVVSIRSTAFAISVPFTETIHFYVSPKQKIKLEYKALLQKLLTPTTEHLLRNALSIQYEADLIQNILFIQSFVQKELTNIFTLPFIAGISIKQKLHKQNFIFASLASNYRSPTLNELFFTPGGNKNLKPETSRNLEGGLENSIRYGAHSLKANTTLFNRDVQNWIVWYGGSILTPHNIQRVWSRGLEMDINYRYEIREEESGIRGKGYEKGDEKGDERYEIKEEESGIRGKGLGVSDVEIITRKNRTLRRHYSAFKINVLYAYTLSTTRESEIDNDYSIGKQIPYVPRYQAKLNVGYTKNDFDIHYVYAYTGYRFVTTDESEYLLPYNTHNVFAAYTLRAKSKHQLLSTFNINNILNKSYESIIGRVMPGRNFSVGIMYKFRS